MNLFPPRIFLLVVRPRIQNRWLITLSSLDHASEEPSLSASIRSLFCSFLILSYLLFGDVWFADTKTSLSVSQSWTAYSQKENHVYLVFSFELSKLYLLSALIPWNADMQHECSKISFIQTTMILRSKNPQFR
jgi:hypothetical protein